MAESPSSCPAPEVLEGIAAGRAESREWRDHLAACAECSSRLERIRDDNRFLLGFTVDGQLPRPPAVEESVTLDVPGYDILREIHRGGQGVVYQAVQRSTKRNVAIKVMRQGPFATLADRARFEREVELLARLEHPHIVAVHDAGVAAGFHFFVMDYIDGLPLDRWAEGDYDEGERGREGDGEEKRAHAPRKSSRDSPHGGQAPRSASLGRRSVREILEVFEAVCDAVHAAHLRGIIHRDLKPSNVFVDASGEPRVLDFGLAKLSQDDSEFPNLQSKIQNPTATGQFVGSLPWASPEQVEGLSSRIDLRTDVYSLGTILFQLLTGNLPFDVGSNLRDALDNILGCEPPRPSTTAAAAGPGAAGRIDDELDTIVLKCLSKDRERRYQSAGDLARDLRRYQAGEPIEAKRDSPWYVLRKAAWRKRRLLLALSIPALLLPIAGAALYRSAAAARQAAQERGLREVEALRNAAMLEITRRLQARPGSAADSPGGRLNLRNAEVIRTDLDTGSLSVSDYGVALLLAETLRDQGSFDAIVEAEGLVRQAIYMLHRDHGPGHPETGRMRTMLADMLLRRGTRMPEAEQMAALAIDELTAAFGAASPEAARGRIMLARIRVARGDTAGAMKAAREALAANDASDSILYAEAQAAIADVHAQLGEQDAARRAYLEALRTLLLQTHDTDSRLLDAIERGASMIQRGVLPVDALFAAGCLRDALAGMKPGDALREVTGVLRGGADGTPRDAIYVPARFVMVGLRERLLGPEDRSLGASLASAASSLLGPLSQSDGYDAPVLSEVEALFRRAIPLQIAAQGPDSPLVGKSYESLATCLVVGGRLREAARWYAKDCELWMRQPPELRDDYQIMLRARWTAWYATRADEYELGLQWTQTALAAVGRTLGPEHGAAALMHACRALCLAGRERMAEALESETLALRLLAGQPVPEDQRAECSRFIGLARVLSNRLNEARAILEPAWQDVESKPEQPLRMLEWASTMRTYSRAIGDLARADHFEQYIRQNGRGDIMPTTAAHDP